MEPSYHSQREMAASTKLKLEYSPYSRKIYENDKNQRGILNTQVKIGSKESIDILEES